jgi:hypothetical protein
MSQDTKDNRPKCQRRPCRRVLTLLNTRRHTDGLDYCTDCYYGILTSSGDCGFGMTAGRTLGRSHKKPGMDDDRNYHEEGARDYEPTDKIND